MAGELVPSGPRKRRKSKPYRRKIHDEFILNRFIRATRAGMSRRKAADFAGVSPDTVDRELLRNAEFAALVRGARADGEFRLLELIHAHAVRDWKAAAWLLARWLPDDWGDRKPNVITAEQMQATITSIVALLLQDLPPDMVVTIAQKVAAISAALQRNADA